MTVEQLRRLLAEAPDDAVVSVIAQDNVWLGFVAGVGLPGAGPINEVMLRLDQ